MLTGGRGRHERYSSVVALITGWLAARYGETVAKWIVTGVVLVVVLVAVAGAGWAVRSCYVRQQVKQTSLKVENAKAEVVKAQDKVRQLEQDADTTDAELAEAKQSERQAEEKLLKTVEADSTSSSADVDAAYQRFCQLYPGDSKCS